MRPAITFILLVTTLIPLFSAGAEEHQAAEKSQPNIVNDLMQAVASHRKQITIAEPVFDMRLKDL